MTADRLAASDSALVLPKFEGESIEAMLKRLKRQTANSGVTKVLKMRATAASPEARRRLKKKLAERKLARLRRKWAVRQQRDEIKEI